MYTMARKLHFNFALFSAFATKAHRNVLSNKPTRRLFPLYDTLYVFEYYFWKYENTNFEPYQNGFYIHPNIKMEQIERIIEAMPFADSDMGLETDLAPGDYPAMIDKHFKTRYDNCDYNINHFFSGEIRALRYHEELY